MRQATEIPAGVTMGYIVRDSGHCGQSMIINRPITRITIMYKLNGVFEETEETEHGGPSRN